VTRLLRRPAGTERGQGLVEFSLILPVIMLLLLGMLEFGFAFDHAIGLGYSTREGARTGAALAEGNPSGPVTCSQVDSYVVAAVQRVIKSPGSQVAVNRVQEIRIFDANGTGGETGTSVNVWTYTPGTGPTVDGLPLDFSPLSVNWSACTSGTRSSAYPADSIGVGIRYTYSFVTPLGAMFNIFGPGTAQLTLSDRTVMAINPGAN
jgi:Flp pilus assembly protein TadG